MLKPVLQLAVLGVLGFAAWKALSFFLLPFFVTLLKIALAVGLAFFVIWWLRKDNDKTKDEPRDAEAPGT